MKVIHSHKRTQAYKGIYRTESPSWI